MNKAACRRNAVEEKEMSAPPKTASAVVHASRPSGRLRRWSPRLWRSGSSLGHRLWAAWRVAEEIFLNHFVVD
jgi:hypothetical protein